jgi:hypothetical protein
MKSHAFGSTWAMSPGVRTIPAAMALPIAAETPNQTPNTWRSFPRRKAPEPGAPLVVDASDVLDNGFSGELQNSAIIMTEKEKASRKSAFLLA